MHDMSSMILRFPKPVAVPQPGFPGSDRPSPDRPSPDRIENPARVEIPGAEIPGAEIPGSEGKARLVRRRASVTTQIGFMRARGMSNTGIRRALGLSEREAVEAGVIPRRVEPNREAKIVASDAVDGCGDDGSGGRSNGLLLAEVLAAVARAGNVSGDEIAGASQGRRLTPLRQLTMYLLRELCDGASLPAIGHFLGRDHTTVHYGCRKAAGRLRNDPDFRLLYETVRASLTQPAEAADG